MKKITVLTIIFTLIFTLGCKREDLYENAKEDQNEETEETEVQKLYPRFYQQEFQGIEPSIMFLGDSRIDYMELDKYFDNHCYNYGYWGADAKYLYEKVMPEIPGDIIADYYVISIGINTYGDRTEMLPWLEKIINEISLQVGKNFIYVTNVVPRSYETTIFINGKVKQLCENMNVNYVHIDKMEDSNGYLKEIVRADNTHYSDYGNKVFANAINDAFEL
jgi:hypothetical protein